MSDESHSSNKIKLAKIFVFLTVYAVNFAFSVFWKLFWIFGYLDTITSPSELLVYSALVFITVLIPAIVLLAVCLVILKNLSKRLGVSKFTVLMTLVMIIGWFMTLLDTFFLVVMSYNRLLLFLGMGFGQFGALISGISENADRANRNAQPSNLARTGEAVLVLGGLGYMFVVLDFASFLLDPYFLIFGPLFLEIGMSLWVIGNSK